jgi:hypothetical protein
MNMKRQSRSPYDVDIFSICDCFPFTDYDRSLFDLSSAPGLYPIG